MRAEIISIGTEIMLGEITDTNASFIASQLPEYGIDLLYVSQIGDNPGRMHEVFERAWGRSDITFLTGGLGPTEDDITRETVAAVLSEEMTVDAEQERILRGIMESRGRRMPERNLKQAMLIPCARALANPRGTAPGWWVERAGPLRRQHGDGGDAGPARGDDRHVGARGGAGAGATRQQRAGLAHAEDDRPRRVDGGRDALAAALRQ